MPVQLSLPGKTKPYVMAHRGNKVKFPENTISAFRQAVNDGADIIETDLHMTSDGHFVCIHDDKVDRTDIFLQADIAARLARQLNNLGVSQRSIILSFSFERLEAMRTASPNLAQGWITLNKPWPRTGVEMLGPLWILLCINPLYVWQAHRSGQLVCPLDPTPEARLGIYLRLGVDAVLSDNPAATCLALNHVRNRSI